MSSNTKPLGPRKVVGKVVERPKRGAGVQTYVPEIAKGLNAGPGGASGCIPGVGCATIPAP